MPGTGSYHKSMFTKSKSLKTWIGTYVYLFVSNGLFLWFFLQAVNFTWCTWTLEVEFDSM
jgi:hypothetical protein